MPRNKVVVRINGSEYTLTGDESEDYLFSIANFVDKKLKEVLFSNPKHSTTSAAVLTSLTLASSIFKMKNDMEMLKDSIREPQERNREIQGQYEKLYQDYESLKNEYAAYVEEQTTKEVALSELKNGYDELYENYAKRNEEFEKLLKENAYLKQHNEELETKLSENQNYISNLKDQLLENQIELVRVKKDFKDIQGKKRSI